MSHLENIFLEEVDETADLESIENNEFAPEGNESNNENENEPPESGTKVQPKRRVVRNPQPKLDPERLRGPRGIAVLEDFFKDFKYKGKGHEKEDLQYLMIRLEHWCHRLFPKYQYDDCLEKIEKLGSKKVVQTFVKKIRLGMVDTEQLNSQVIENDVLPDTNDPADPFDLLLDQQLLDVSSKSKQNEAFDSLMQ